MSLPLSDVQIAALDGLLKDLDPSESKSRLDPNQTYGFDFTINIRGQLTKHEDTERKPTVSTPWLTVIALFVRRCGIQREESMKIILEAMTEAMEAGKDKEKLDALYKATGIYDARREYDKQVLSKLPKAKVNGQVRCEDLVLEVIE